MKLKKPKLFIFTVLSFLLIAFIFILILFVYQVSRPVQSSGNLATPSPSQAAQKNIYYISNNLASSDEYELVSLLKGSFEKNENLQYKILDSNGMLPVQINHIENSKKLPIDLLIVNPIDAQKIPAQIGEVNFPVIYSGLQQQETGATSIRFSDDSAAQLIVQHVFSAIYPGSSICIVGTSQNDNLYKTTLNALQKTSKVYGTTNKIKSYFSENIEMVKLSKAMPDLLQSQSVIILDPLNMDTILQYLNTNTYSKDTIAVSQDKKMISRILDGSLQAIVYREKAILAKSIYQNAIAQLNGKPSSTLIECYQGLLNTNNVIEYMETEKNSTY
jgi:DNA-binding LacI/PurR family transcriptional regulator